LPRTRSRSPRVRSSSSEAGACPHVLGNQRRADPAGVDPRRVRAPRPAAGADAGAFGLLASARWETGAGTRGNESAHFVAEGAAPGSPPPARRLAAGHSRALEFAVLAAAAIAAPLAWWIFAPCGGEPTATTTSTSYWLAPKLITLGQSPYDVEALRALARTEHLHSLSAAATSTRSPSRLAMIPVHRAVVQQRGPAVQLALSCPVRTERRRLDRLGARWTAELQWRRLALAAAGGYFPDLRHDRQRPGQPDPLSLDRVRHRAGARRHKCRATVRRRVLAGLAAIVKLVPGVLAVPLVIGRRIDAAAGDKQPAPSARCCSRPARSPGRERRKRTLSAVRHGPVLHEPVVQRVRQPDRPGFRSNSALWKTPGFPHPKLADAGPDGGIRPGERPRRPVDGTAADLPRARPLALGIAFALVAGVNRRPKNSFWNQPRPSRVWAPAGSRLGRTCGSARLGRTDLILLGCWNWPARRSSRSNWTFRLRRRAPSPPMVSLLRVVVLNGLLGVVGGCWRGG